MDAKVDFDGEKPLLMILRQKYPKLTIVCRCPPLSFIK